MLQEDDLPRRYACVCTSFRKDGGESDGDGIFCAQQFDQVQERCAAIARLLVSTVTSSLSLVLDGRERRSSNLWSRRQRSLPRPSHKCSSCWKSSINPLVVVRAVSSELLRGHVPTSNRARAGLSYRVLRTPSAAMEHAATKQVTRRVYPSPCSRIMPMQRWLQYSLECWFPGSKRFRELSSCSNCTDFQVVECVMAYTMPNTLKSFTR